MECAQSAGIDLPLKALVWQDDAQQVRLGFNDPAWLAQRRGAASRPVADNLRKAPAGLAEAAVAHRGADTRHTRPGESLTYT